MRRELTKHVVTRWYRAPELILLSEHYTAAIDMWSVGCILAELLSMQAESHTSPEDRQALFPGRSCFPLSADNPLAYNDQLDQLNVIFDVIGTPSSEDLQQVDNETARGYIGGLKAKPPVNLYGRYMSADPMAVDLLTKLLVFNPSKRWTASRCLAHPFFDTVRDELVGLRYREGSDARVDFRFEDKTLTRETIRALIVEELLVDNPQLAEQIKGRKQGEGATLNGADGMGMGGPGSNGGGYNHNPPQAAPPLMHAPPPTQQPRSRNPVPQPPPQPSNGMHRMPPPAYSTYDAPPYAPSLSHSRSSPSNLSHPLDLYPPPLDGGVSGDMAQLQHAIHQYAAQHAVQHEQVGAVFRHDNLQPDPSPAVGRRTAAGATARGGAGASMYEQPPRVGQYGQAGEYGYADGGVRPPGAAYPYAMNGDGGGYVNSGGGGGGRKPNGASQQQPYGARQR